MIKFYSFNVDPRWLYRDNEQVLSIVKDSRVADSYILGCATGGSGEVGIGEHSSWGGLTT